MLTANNIFLGEKIRDTEASSETPSYLVWYLLQKYLYEGINFIMILIV
jgi:hypothetical protein